jgi:preprotein translocase subunit SecB
MSQTSSAVPPQGQAPAGQPPLVVNVQYVKDLSFEVPGAPQIYQRLRAQPQVGINLDVQVRKLQEPGAYEVALVIRAEAREGAAQGTQPPGEAGLAVFIAEITYAGVFTLTGIPENAIEPVLLVECPRLLFPYARNILGEVTREGGFPPVLLQPIDFVALWQARRAQTSSPGAPVTLQGGQATIPAGNALA